MLQIYSLIKKALPKIFLGCLFFISLLVFYHGIQNTYFQQDEWHKTGKTIYYLYANFGDIFTRKFAFHYFPLTNLYFALEYLLFGLHYMYYSYIGLVLQALAGLSLFILLKRLFDKRLLAFMLSFLFIISPSIYQVLLNEMVSYYTLSFILVCWFFIVLYDHITTEKSLKIKKFLILLTLFSGAIFINEIWLGLIILAPAFFLLFRSSKFFLRFNKRNILLLLLPIVIVVLRLIFEIYLPADSLRPVGASPHTSTLYNALTLPFKLLTQYLFDLDNLNTMAKVYQSKISYFRNDKTVNQDLMAITVIYDIIVFYLSALLVGFVGVLVYLKQKNIVIKKRLIKLLLFSFIWIVTIDIILSPQQRFFTSIESRYMYLGAFGMILFMGTVLSLLWEKVKEYRFLRIIFVILISIYFVSWSIYARQSIQQQVQAVVKISLIRKSILQQIQQQSLQVPSKTVMYIYCSDDCSSNNLHGMPKEWIVPFQNGFGWNLLILLAQDNPKKYAPFFKGDFLWERMATGYKEIDGTGFGYFTDLHSLKETIATYDLLPENVVIYRYDSKRYKLVRVRNVTKILYSQDKLIVNQ